MLSVCKEQSNPSTTGLPTSTNINQPNVGSMPKQQENDDARLSTKTPQPQPSNSPSPFVDESAWIGIWKWDQTTKNELSTLKIKNIKDGKLFFSLNGELADETAILIGNEAIYKDGKSDFELHISMVDHQLMVMTKGKESPFGAFVEVDGRYSKEFEHTQTSNNIADVYTSDSPQNLDSPNVLGFNNWRYAERPVIPGES